MGIMYDNVYPQAEEDTFVPSFRGGSWYAPRTDISAASTRHEEVWKDWLARELSSPLIVGLWRFSWIAKE